jgi:hypothetical protein
LAKAITSLAPGTEKVFFIEKLMSEFPIGGALREGYLECGRFFWWFFQQDVLLVWIPLKNAQHFFAHWSRGNFSSVTQAVGRLKPIALSRTVQLT